MPDGRRLFHLLVGSAGLTTVAASPLLPMLAETSGNGTGYDFRLGGAVVASLQAGSCS